MQFLAIAIYRGIVAGEPTGSLDLQVRYLVADSEEAARQDLEQETPEKYSNHHGELVSWELRKVMCIEEVADIPGAAAGEELIGFVANAKELCELV